MRFRIWNHSVAKKKPHEQSGEAEKKKKTRYRAEFQILSYGKYGRAFDQDDIQLFCYPAPVNNAPPPPCPSPSSNTETCIWKAGERWGGGEGRGGGKRAHKEETPKGLRCRFPSRRSPVPLTILSRLVPSYVFFTRRPPVYWEGQAMKFTAEEELWCGVVWCGEGTRNATTLVHTYKTCTRYPLSLSLSLCLSVSCLSCGTSTSPCFIHPKQTHQACRLQKSHTILQALPQPPLPARTTTQTTLPDAPPPLI